MCHGILPTRSLLFRRHVLVQTECPFCQREEEADVHFLLKCDYARAIWFGSVLTIKSEDVQVDSIRDWLKVYVEDGFVRSQTRIQITCYLIESNK